MFDVSRAETYDNIIGWKDDIRSVNSRRTLPCIIIANKVCSIRISINLFFIKFLIF
jgi:hypothetical protein